MPPKVGLVPTGRKRTSTNKRSFSSSPEVPTATIHQFEVVSAGDEVGHAPPAAAAAAAAVQDIMAAVGGAADGQALAGQPLPPGDNDAVSTTGVRGGGRRQQEESRPCLSDQHPDGREEQEVGFSTLHSHFVESESPVGPGDDGQRDRDRKQPLPHLPHGRREAVEQAGEVLVAAQLLVGPESRPEGRVFYIIEKKNGWRLCYAKLT